MPTVQIDHIVRINGVLRTDLSYSRRREIDELQPFDYTKADNGDGTTFDALPMSQLDTIQVLSIRTDAVATVRLDGQSDAGIVLAAGGAIDLIDVTIDAGAGASNASANANGTTPQLRGFGGGT